FRHLLVFSILFPYTTLFRSLSMTFMSPLLANEGMWFLMHIERLNYRDMQKMGLQLTPEEIYSINNQSLKDGIVQFNGGCTASIIDRKSTRLNSSHVKISYAV